MATWPQDYQDGDELSAGWQNSLKAGVLAARIVAEPPLAVDHTPTKQVLRWVGPQEADFKVTSGGSGGIYGGVEQRPTSGGGWETRPGGRTVTTTTDPLRERTANTAVPITGSAIVRARRVGRSGPWFFSYGTCSS